MLYYVPAVIGIFLIGFGVYHGYALQAFIRRCTVRTEGVVEAFVCPPQKGRPLYFPVISYRDRDGKVQRKQYRWGDSQWHIQVGDSVSLQYNPQNYDEFYLYAEQATWRQYANAFCIILGGIIFISAYYRLAM